MKTPEKIYDEWLAGYEYCKPDKLKWRAVQAMKEFAEQEAAKNISSKPMLADSLPLSEGKFEDTEADGIVFCGKCGKQK